MRSAPQRVFALRPGSGGRDAGLAAMPTWRSAFPRILTCLFAVFWVPVVFG